MTVKFEEVKNFASMSKDNAEALIYDKLIPICEAKGVKLIGAGNVASQQALSMKDYTVEQYEQEKADRTLFRISTIQRAHFDIPTIFRGTTQYRPCNPKKTLESVQRQHISFGEMVVAMLLRGHKARFGKAGSEPTFRCSFAVKVLPGAEKVIKALREAGFRYGLPEPRRLVKKRPRATQTGSSPTKKIDWGSEERKLGKGSQ